MKKEVCLALVLAAGSGKRMNAGTEKQFLTVEGKPILWYSLDCFERSPLVDGVILVTSEERIDYCREGIVEPSGFRKVRKIIAGGRERYDSVWQGLLSCEGADYVLIHDSARPFVTERILQSALDGARKYGAAIAAVPSKDTVKLSDREGFVRETPDRRDVWIIQTPQAFRFDLILKAHRELRREGMTGITDDAMVVEKAFGTKVFLSEGSYRNIKITTPEDLVLAKAFLAERHPHQ